MKIIKYYLNLLFQLVINEVAKMKYHIVQMNRTFASEIVKWKYEDELSIYNLDNSNHFVNFNLTN